MKTIIGVISDTHGVIHPSVPEAFRGVERIIHAGDVGGLNVLEALTRIAPVIGVRGNYDTSAEVAARLLPDPSGIKTAGLPALLTHRLFAMGWPGSKQAIADMLARGPDPVRLVIFGHTHIPALEEISGIWFINPGYAGPDPLEGPASVAVIVIEGQKIEGEIIML